MVKLQYCSDIHLEFLEQFPVRDVNISDFNNIITPGQAPYLVLAGDIGQPHFASFRSFFEWCSQNWKDVFYVTGNHEYYSNNILNTPMDLIDDEIGRQLSDLKNVHWLCLGCPGGNMSYDIPDTDISIVGTTLWTDIDDNIVNDARMFMMDYKLIMSPHPHPTKGYIPIQPYEISILHMIQKQNLFNEIKELSSKGRRIVVVTHHMPSYRLIAPRFEGSELNCCFTSHSDDLIRLPGVIAWIYGHTHDVRKTMIGKCVCAINAMGYPHEQKETYSQNAVLDLDCIELTETEDTKDTKDLVTNTIEEQK